ncbi:MAG: MBL fold metallo-hydrolase [Chloroflexota bacterium]
MANHISRRNLIKGMGAGAAAALLGGKVATGFAQIGGPSEGIIGIYRLSFGDFQITVFKDNFSALNTSIMGTEDQAEAIQAELASVNLPTDELVNTFNIMMIESADGVFLVDSGLGGALVPSMAAVGMTPEDVTNIIGTHWHPDHVGGLSTDGAINFPNATYHLSQTEFDFIQENAGAFTEGAAAAIAPYADGDQLALYNAEDELAPGIQAVAAMGHTPGHHAILLASGGNQLMHVVDSTISAYVHVPNPTFSIQFDADPVMAADTRTGLLQRIADEGMAVMGYHFPFPGLGTISEGTGDDAFRFTPYN